MPMTEAMDDFCVEVRRIVECPYTPSLKVSGICEWIRPRGVVCACNVYFIFENFIAITKKLHEFLRNTDINFLHRWARSNACQIERLTAVILEGLELWPFVLEMLSILAWVPAFRDAALQQKPTLLNSLLMKTTESASGLDKFGPACLSLLSTPLEVAVPSCFPKFLESLLERAVQLPSSETIRPVYRALSGLGPSYLEDLPLGILTCSQTQLTEVLTKVDIDDPLANVLCLAVLAKFASKPCHPAKMNVSNPSSNPFSIDDAQEPVDKFLPARKFFSNNKAQKTLDLAVFKVIDACSSRSLLSLNGALECLSLCEEIIDALGSDEKTSLVNIGRAKKLYEKILRPDIEPILQCAALNFVSALSNGEDLPEELKPTFEKILLTPKAIILSPRALSICIVSLGPAVISQAVFGLLRLACGDQSPSSEGLARFDSALKTVSAITTIASRYPVLRQSFVTMIFSKDTSSLLHQFASKEIQSFHFPKDHSIEVCLPAYVDTKARLHQRLAVMILSFALDGSPYEEDVRFVLMLLLEKQTMLSNAHFACTEYRSLKSALDWSSLSLFEASSTPRVNTISHDWRNLIVRELSRDASHQYSSIIRMVGEICRDLELRCDDAERPFREEQSISRKLQEDLTNAQARISELEVRAQAQTANLKDLEEERDDLSKQNEVADNRLREYSITLEKIQQEFKEAENNAERIAQTAIESSRERDLAYLATLTAKDEMLEDQALKLVASECRASNLDDDLARSRAQEARDAESISSNRSKLEDLKIALSEAESLITSKQAEINRLIESEAKLISSKEEVTMQAQEISDHYKSLLSDRDEHIHAANTKIAELQHEHEVYADRMSAEILRLEDDHKSLNGQWRAKLDEARRSAMTAREQSISQITSLQSKIKKLRKEHDERDKEFAEAQGLSSRLMAIMGNVGNQSTVLGTKSRAITQETGNLLSEDEDYPDRPISNVNAALSFGSSTSSRSGPTPKRNKTYRYSHSQGPQISKGNKAATNTRSIRRSIARGKTPLGEPKSTQNVGQLTPTQRISWEACQKNGDGDGEPLQENNGAQGWKSDESFGEGDVFTSTDQQQLSASRIKLATDTFDETTVEF